MNAKDDESFRLGGSMAKGGTQHRGADRMHGAGVRPDLDCDPACHNQGISEMSEPVLICVACGGPVIVERERYEVFERMHWICFHYEFEHGLGVLGTLDRDSPCGDSSCPRRPSGVVAE